MPNPNARINTIVAVVVVVIFAGWYLIKGNSLTPSTPAASQTTDATQPSTQQPTQQTQTNLQPPSSTPSSMKTVTIETNKGTIVFETFPADAPKAVNNFVNLAQKGFYDGVIFHRVINGFMIQGGDPTGTGMGGPGYQFEDELNPSTPSYKLGYQKGIVAMANAGPNTNGSQFFIMLENNPLPHSYTIFGRVVSGQDVVDAIGKVQTAAGDKPVVPVVMKKVTVK